MRVLKIELSGVLQPKGEGPNLESDVVATQLFRELDGLKLDLAERMRAKATAYLPADYVVFVRVAFQRVGTRVNATFWIDDPTISGLSGLLARRAWRLSVPILAHVFREAVQERLQTFGVLVDDTKPAITAFAPTRGWYNPIFIAVVVAALSALYWLAIHGPLWGSMRGLLGG